MAAEAWPPRISPLQCGGSIFSSVELLTTPSAWFLAVQTPCAANLELTTSEFGTLDSLEFSSDLLSPAAPASSLVETRLLGTRTSRAMVENADISTTIDLSQMTYDLQTMVAWFYVSFRILRLFQEFKCWCDTSLKTCLCSFFPWQGNMRFHNLFWLGLFQTWDFHVFFCEPRILWRS